MSRLLILGQKLQDHRADQEARSLHFMVHSTSVHFGLHAMQIGSTNSDKNKKNQLTLSE